MLDELRSGVNSSPSGHEFNGNESTICIKYGVFKQKRVQNKFTCLSVDENVMTRRSQEPNPIFPPKGNDSVFMNSVFVVTFLTITIL